MKEVTFILLIVIMWMFGCSESDSANKLDSDNYNNRTERVEVLRKEIKAPSEFEDAEFELFNVNGFANSRTMVPGASSWDYKFAVKVKLSDLDKWTEGLVKKDLKDYNDEWVKDIVEKRRGNWKTQGRPEYYIRAGENVTVVVYKDDGIVFKRVISN